MKVFLLYRVDTEFKWNPRDTGILTLVLYNLIQWWGVIAPLTVYWRAISENGQ